MLRREKKPTRPLKNNGTKPTEARKGNKEELDKEYRKEMVELATQLAIALHRDALRELERH